MKKHFLYYGFSKLVPGVVNFLAMLIYARIFTVKEYGNYSYIIAIVGLVQTVLYSWLSMSSFRFYQRNVNSTLSEKKYINYIFSMFIIITILFILFWFPIVSVLEKNITIKNLLYLSAGIIIFKALFEQIISLFRAQLDSKKYAMYSAVKAIIQILFVLILVVIFKMDEKAILIGIILAHFLPSFYYFLRYKKFSNFVSVIKDSNSKEFLHYGIPLTVTFLFNYILTTSDRILINYYETNKSVGIYSISYDFANFIVTNVFMIINLSYYPIIIKTLENKGNREAQKVLLKYSKIISLVMLPLTLYIAFFSPYITELLLGKQYNSKVTEKIIILVAISTLLSGMKAYYFDFSFQLAKNTKKQIIPIIFASILNILLNIIFIPRVGLIGAVFATLFAYIVGLILSIYIGQKIFKLPFGILHYIKNLIIVLIIAIITKLIPLYEINWVSFIIKTAIFFILYCGIVLMIIKRRKTEK